MLTHSVAKLCTQQGPMIKSCRCLSAPLLLEKNESVVAAERRERSAWENIGWESASPAPNSPVRQPSPAPPALSAPRAIPFARSHTHWVATTSESATCTSFRVVIV